MIEFKRIRNGYFESFKDGIKTQFIIVNGSLGCSGNGKNEYLIHNTITYKYTPVRSLGYAKKSIQLSLK